MNVLPATHTTSLDPAKLGDIRQQAVELEGVFLNTLVKQMMSGVETEGMFGGGQAEETWRSMQSEYLADQIAAAGGIGLADDIMRTLLAQQEAVTPNAQ